MDSMDFVRIAGIPLPLLRGDEHPCAYLPDRIAADVFTFPGLAEVDSRLYEKMMDRGFRRSGSFFYKPVCETCRECVPIRVPVARFEPSRSQRRVLKRNADVRVEAMGSADDDEHFAVYERYQRARHPTKPAGDRADYERFLCDSPIDTLALDFRVRERLIGVSILDACPNSLSSVYFYYDPDESKRSPGVFSALCEIQECRRRGLAYWYVGFRIRGCPKMEYKTRFRPYELLRMDELERGRIVWQPSDAVE